MTSSKHRTKFPCSVVNPALWAEFEQARSNHQQPDADPREWTCGAVRAWLGLYSEKTPRPPVKT